MRVPVNTQDCKQALAIYSKEVNRLNDEFLDLAATFTADEILQNGVAQELWKLTKR